MQTPITGNIKPAVYTYAANEIFVESIKFMINSLLLDMFHEIIP